ncbi:hypothetical protein QE152_g33016 [Popillia japonica]|uniref:Uncharacterized protein n=1 Tax=Popillia japonica TaxID=7064 RepID=A0AAW1IYV0_POPJA
MNFFRRIQWCDRFRDATHGLEVTAPGHIMEVTAPGHIMGEAVNRARPPCRPAADASIPIDGQLVNRARPPCRPAADASIPIDGQLQNLEYLPSLMNFFRRIQWCDRFRDATHGLEVTAPGHIMGEAVNRARPPCRPAADASIPIDGQNFFRRIQWCDRFRDATHGLEVTAPGHIMGEAVNRARPPCRPAADASIPIDGQLQNLSTELAPHAGRQRTRPSRSTANYKISNISVTVGDTAF